MRVKLRIVCSRCQREVNDAYNYCHGATSGYYEVSHGIWQRYANAGEVYLCDPCMKADARYQAHYGIRQSQPKPPGQEA